MDNITGFIVEVKSKSGETVEYTYNNEKTILSGNDVFVGYFWQMTVPEKDGEYYKAHITKISLIDKQKLLFRYEKEAVFDTNEVEITIKAKRGPESNNKFLEKTYDKYETWNSVARKSAAY